MHSSPPMSSPSDPLTDGDGVENNVLQEDGLHHIKANGHRVYGQQAGLAHNNFKAAEAHTVPVVHTKHTFSIPQQASETPYKLLEDEESQTPDDEIVIPNRTSLSQLLSECKRLFTNSHAVDVVIEEQSSTTERLFILMVQSFPIIVSFFLNVGGTFINLVFAGHYVPVKGVESTIFAGVSLTNMFANVTHLSLLLGMSSAVETLGSQHNGAKNYDEVGIVLWRSIMILGIMLVPISFIWFFSGAIFNFLGVDPVVCDVVNNYLRIHILTMPIDVVAVSYEKYLMSIGVMRPTMWSQIVFNASVFIFDCIFVYGFKLGYQCLAWSWVISVYLAAAVQFALSWYHPSVQRTLRPWSKEALTEWGNFISLGLPGTIMLCSEWWAYEVLVLFASVLGTEEVSAETVILQSSSLVFMIPSGLGVAATSIVGNALGAGQRGLSMQLSRLSLNATLGLEVFVAISVYLWGENFINMCTPDEIVRKIAVENLPFLSAFTIVDGIQVVASGILRGAGRQSVGAILNVVAFYAIGLPMAYVLCFKAHMGVNGLVSGISIGAAFQVTVLLYLIVFRESYVFDTTAVVEEPGGPPSGELPVVVTAAAGGGGGGGDPRSKSD